MAVFAAFLSFFKPYFVVVVAVVVVAVVVARAGWGIWIWKNGIFAQIEFKNGVGGNVDS